MISASDMVIEIRRILYEALSAGSLTSLCDRSLGSVSITKSTTIQRLQELEKYYLEQSKIEDNDGGNCGEYQSVVV